jgi:hypothetical protein
MTASGPIPDEGELQLGTIRLPAGRLLRTGDADEPAGWITESAVPDPGPVWTDSLPEPWQAGEEKEWAEELTAPPSGISGGTDQADLGAGYAYPGVSRSWALLFMHRHSRFSRSSFPESGMSQLSDMHGTRICPSI